MRQIANAFLIGFLADAGLSLCDAALRLAADSHVLSAPRGVLSVAVVIASLVIYLLMGATPRLPWRILLPPCLFLTWVAMLAMPLPIWLGVDGTLVALPLIQLSVAVGSLVLTRRATGGASWLFTEVSLEGPRFAWRTALGFTALNLLVILPVSIAYLFAAAAAGLSYGTAGFLRMDTSGLYALGRTYTLDDQTVHLIAMMHIGESDYYATLMDSLPADGSLILAEGVSDTQRLIPSGLSYDGLADTLGLVAQGSLGGDDQEVVPADVDISEFAPETLRLLNGVSELLAAETRLDALAAYSRLVEMRPDTAMFALLRHDLIDLRNERVLAALESSLPAYRHLIVPWGALHMPGIESRVLELGFSPGESREWRILRF